MIDDVVIQHQMVTIKHSYCSIEAIIEGTTSHRTGCGRQVGVPDLQEWQWITWVSFLSEAILSGVEVLHIGLGGVSCGLN